MASSRLPKFQENFKKLRGDLTQAQFADKLGLSRPTIGLYESGARIPDAEVLRIIAEKCDVTTDYLLGLSDSPTVKEDIQAAIKVTGLSQKAIENIVYWSVDDLFLDTLDQFLSHDNSADFIHALSTALGNAVAIPAQWDAEKDEFESQGLFSELSQLEYFMKELKYSVFEVSESATSLVSDMAGINQLKEKLNSRIDEIMKERYHGGE